MAEQIKIFSVEIQGSDEAVKSLNDIEVALRKNRKQRNEILKEQEKGRKLTAEESLQVQKLEQTIEKQNQQKQRLVKETRNAIKLQEAEKGSLIQLEARVALLTAQWDNLGKEQRENTDQGKALGQEIEGLNKKIREQREGVGDNTRSIGNYQESIEKALQSTGLYNTGIARTIIQLKGFKKGLRDLKFDFLATNKGISAANKNLKLFRIALISTGIGAILVALGSLIALLTKTQKGLNFTTKILDQLGAVVNTVLGRFSFLGESIAKLFKGDFSGAAESATKAFSGLKDEIVETVKAAGELADLTVKFKNENREIRVQIAELEARRRLQRDIAEDDTTGFNERAKFYKAEAETIKEIAVLQERSARNNLTLIEREINQLRSKNLAISDEQKDALADAQIALKAATSDRLQVERDSEELRRKAIRDLFEYELDFLIDTQEKQKQINAERLKDDSISLDERRAILEETARLSEESFQRQIAAVEEFTGKKIDFDSLAAESDARTIFNRLKLLDLDDITLNRAREIIQERKLLLNDFANFENDLRKEEFEDEQQLRDDLQALDDEFFAIIEEKEQEHANKLDEINKDLTDKELERLKTIQQERELINDLILEGTADLAQATFDIVKNFQDRQIEAVKQRQEEGVISEAEAANEIAEIQRKQAITERAQALFNIALNTAQAVAKVWGETGLAGALLQALPIAMGVAQAGVVLSQPLPPKAKFSDGGIIQGASHANGGVPFTVNGVGGFEAEGGEVIINKRSAAMFRNQLSEINAAGGGVRFANGGPVPQVQSVAQSLQASMDISDRTVDRIVNGINDKKVVNDPIDALIAQNKAVTNEQTGDF